MVQKNILYLGSKSSSRRILLDSSRISYCVLEQDADESLCNWGLPLEQLVAEIALFKMDHVVLPVGKEGQIIFVLTADTMAQDTDGTVQGKPIDYADAVLKIQKARLGSRLSTAFCLDKKIWKNGAWQVQKRVQQVVNASYCIDIPDDLIDIYFANSHGMACAGAVAVEDFGAQFLRTVQGSYSAIIGLPLFEVRLALYEMGFFE